MKTSQFEMSHVMPSYVYAIATMDTKGEELAYVRQCLQSAGVAVKMVDVGTAATPTVQPDITRDEVTGQKWQPTVGSDRGAAVGSMSCALAQFMCTHYRDDCVAGVIGIGGSGGTAIITTAMRALPIGLPKLMVSTVASGNTAPYVDCSDITMMYSVVDVAGLNTVSRRVLANAAHAMAGMVGHTEAEQISRPALGMTMFGVTTPCVDAVRRALDQRGYDCLVFHATGSGGRAMEKLVASGMIQGVLDITTTEVADEIVGGVMPGGPDRFDAIVRQQIPYVVSLGALDMVNFEERDSVPAKFAHRLFHVHNQQVTLMRTSPEENRLIARWIAEKLNRATSPVTVIIPEGGVSMLDAPGQVFYDPPADAVLFDELESSLRKETHCRCLRSPLHINSPQFAQQLVDEFLRWQQPAMAKVS